MAQLLDAREVAKAIIAKIAPEEKEKLNRKITKSWSIDLGKPGELHASASQTNEIARRDIAFSHLLELIPSNKWKRPLCVMVDEIQNVEKRVPKCYACLDAFHLGTHGLPIVMVCAGLGDSGEQLGKADLTRLGDVHNLGGLESTEVEKFIKGMLDNCEVDWRTWSNIDKLTGDIAKRTDCWP